MFSLPLYTCVCVLYIYIYTHIVMVNFMYQFGWATGRLAICSNIILGVSLRMFWDEINIYIDGL